MKKYSHIIAFGLILILGITLRLYKLGEVPGGFFRDEAALGYNSFSILKTGRDEFGKYLPIIFRSFEVFFLPLYVYLSSIVVAIFGLSEFSTRFLSFFSGSFALISIYLIVKEIWNKETALVSMLILAISPWAVFYSRGAFEGNLALTLFSFGVLFWIRYFKEEKIGNIIFSGTFFAASMYSYQAERLVVPLLGIILIYFSLNKLVKERLKIVPIIILLLILLIPLLSITFSPGGLHRASGVSIFAKEEKPPGYIAGLDEGLFQNNKTYLRIRQITSLYLSYFSPKNLFINSDFDKQRSVVNFSVFYFWTLPFLFIGFADVIKKKDFGKKIILAWILIAPLPAAMTGDPFHTYRSLLLYFPLSVVIGVGLTKAYFRLNNFQKKLFTISIGILLLSFLSFFIYSYFYLTRADRARSWDYGYKEIMSLVKILPEESRIIIEDPWTEAYIHHLFFLQIDPAIYQNEVKKAGYPEDFYYSDVRELRPVRFKSVEYRKIDWPKERGDSGTIFIVYAPNLPESEFMNDLKVEVVKNINYPNGSIAYRVLRIK